MVLGGGLRAACAEEVEVSDADRFWRKVDKGGGPNACWLWTASLDKKGYGDFWYGGRMIGAHRAVLLLSGVEIPDGMCACHRCDVPRCVNPSHLFIGTRIDNNADRDAKGRNVVVPRRGESNSLSKLTADQVLEIRRLYADGVSQGKIAPRFGVSRSNVEKIVHRETWAHVPAWTEELRKAHAAATHALCHDAPGGGRLCVLPRGHEGLHEGMLDGIRVAWLPPTHPDARAEGGEA